MKISIVRAWIICLSAILCESAFADGAPLFRALNADQEATTFTPAERKRIDEVRKSPGTRRATVISIDRNALFGNVLNVTAPDGTVVTFTKERSDTTEEILWLDKFTSKKEKVFSWVGRSPMGGEALFSYGENGTVVGGIRIPRKNYLQVKPINGSYQLLLEDDPLTGPKTGGDDVGVPK